MMEDPAADHISQLNSTYETAFEIHPYGNVTASNPYGFEIYGDSALMTVHRHAQANLSPMRGPVNAKILTSVLQEIEIETGNIVFNWNASDYFSPRDLIDRYDSRKESSHDIFHINSVDKDDEGNYILLFRYLQAVVCVSPDGDVLWILGGKRNSFLDLSDGAATRVTSQQFAKWQPGNIIHLVEDDAPDRRDGMTAVNEGLRIVLDPENITAALLDDDTNLTATSSHFREAPRPTSSGNSLVGSKHSRPYTESSASGGVSCEADVTDHSTDRHSSYHRKFKGPWLGRPKKRPDVAIRKSFTNTNVYVSWNGATDVRSWRLETAGEKAGETILDLQHRGHDSFNPLITVPRAGFETKIQTKTSSRYIRVVALDEAGITLGSSIIDTKTNIVVMVSHSTFHFSKLLSPDVASLAELLTLYLNNSTAFHTFILIVTDFPQYNSSRLQVSNTAARDITLSWLVIMTICAVFYQIWKRAPTRHAWQNTRLRKFHDLAYMKRDDIPWSKIESHYHLYLEPSPTFRAKARSVVVSVLSHPLFPRRLRQMFARYPTGG